MPRVVNILSIQCHHVVSMRAGLRQQHVVWMALPVWVVANCIEVVYIYISTMVERQGLSKNISTVYSFCM